MRKDRRFDMRFQVDQGNIAEQAVDCIVVNLFEGVTVPGGATGAVDRALDGAISQLIAGGDFDGKAETAALLYTNGRLPAPVCWSSDWATRPSLI